MMIFSLFLVMLPPNLVISLTDGQQNFQKSLFRGEIGRKIDR